MNVDPPISRTRQYVEQRSQQRMAEHRLAGLEAQLEEEERRNLRLSNQLLDEVTMRARAERTRDDLRAELDTLKLPDLEPADEPDRKRKPAKSPRKSRNATRAGGTDPEQQSVVIPDGGLPAQSDKNESKPKKSSPGRKKPTSSRTRGSVK